MKQLALHWKILIGLTLGVMIGAVLNVWGETLWHAVGVFDSQAFLRHRPPSAEAIAAGHEPSWLAHVCGFMVNLTGFIGDLFMRSLRFIAVPIVLFSLIVGASSLNDLKKLSRIGGMTVGIYLLTTAIAISIGLLLANLLEPGTFVSPETREALAAGMRDAASTKIGVAETTIATTTTWSQFLNIVPRNPFQAVAEGNMLQVVFFALAVGIALTRLPTKLAGPVIQISEAMTEVIITIVHVIMRAAPVAVFALLIPIVASMGFDVLYSLIIYCAVVVGGLATMMFGVYPAMIVLFSKVGYGHFMKGIAPAQLLGFSSSSSSATLPVTMQCAEERIGMSDEISSFVLPLGATINMDGTALYQGVAAVFIAQMFNMDLDFAQQLTIVLTATLASIGTAGVPGVGIVMLVIVLQTVGIPTEGIAVILGVDRLLDMCRTACNITGDAMVATVIASREGHLLTAEEMATLVAEREAAAGEIDDDET